MEGLLTLIGIIALVMAILPRGAIVAMKTWQFSDKDANEPSDAAIVFHRIGCLIGAVALFFALAQV
ncbi:hypothetical protein JGS22_007840 [Streptomyces sp. P38-E01]|uniref:DUF6199 domain-containing protein n=1 Tax=Streptomyces tardus TaxID=2780544 RepID=A0A949JCW0_9ACTN|nr:hypothetical protein [Streptomyces tardus]MBU7597536.1 hypothetical protein [Streptomyces tardus]